MASAFSRNLVSLASKRFLVSRPTVNAVRPSLIRRFSSYPPHEVVGLPSLSPTMEAGSIASWNVGVGDKFGAGDILCSVETDKATVDFEAQDEGVVAKILAPAGPAEIQCGHPILVTVEDEGDVSAFTDFEAAVAEATPPPTAAPETPPPPPTAAAAPASPPPATPSPAPVAVSTGDRVIASPRAHMISKELGYDISAIPGTGPGGRVIAADVQEYVPPMDVAAAAPAVAPPAVAPGAAAVAAPVAAPVPGVGFTDYPVSATAQEAAMRLAQAKRNVPHYYLTVDISMDELLKIRSTLNGAIAGSKSEDVPQLGVYELLIKAAAAAMKAVPSANASWMESVVRVYDSVDINVVLGSGDSQVSPIIRNCGGRGVKNISDDLSVAMASLEAVDEDVVMDASMGTFTIINLGMYGVKSCAPIIREPQACALAIGSLENRIVPNDDTESEEIYKESVMMTATLSCDHRVVDGAVGAQWLSAFKSHVENPSTLLL